MKFNVQFTVDERDAIYRAKGRLGRFINLLQHLSEDETEDNPAIPDVLNIMADDMETIDATFTAADKRGAR